MLLRADGRLEMLDAGGPLIGLGGGWGFDEAEVSLTPGDRLFLYTDGVVERADSTDAQVGEQRLCDAVHTARELPLEAACDRLMKTVVAFGAGCPPRDDITLLALEFVGGSVKTST